MKKFIITEQYSDVCFFMRSIEIEANNEEEAEELYNEGEIDYKTISDEIYSRCNDDLYCEITQIKEVK